MLLLTIDLKVKFNIIHSIIVSFIARFFFFGFNNSHLILCVLYHIIIPSEDIPKNICHSLIFSPTKFSIIDKWKVLCELWFRKNVPIFKWRNW